jgi:3'-phosphoadenosine 5'-phosphosulfate sulfotransferase (PAPS reductase)/FAD synthetase
MLSTAKELNALADEAGIRLVVIKQPFLRDFTMSAETMERWALARFGQPLVIGFSGRNDSSAPALFNVYSNSSGNKTGELSVTK